MGQKIIFLLHQKNLTWQSTPKPWDNYLAWEEKCLHCSEKHFRQITNHCLARAALWYETLQTHWSAGGLICGLLDREFTHWPPPHPRSKVSVLISDRNWYISVVYLEQMLWHKLFWYQYLFYSVLHNGLSSYLWPPWRWSRTLHSHILAHFHSICSRQPAT